MTGTRRARLLLAAGLALAGLALGGCSWLRAANEPTDLPAVMTGRKVTVQLRWSGDDPLPTAEKYCAEVGGYPWPLELKSSRASYECVADGRPHTGGRNGEHVGPALGSRGSIN